LGRWTARHHANAVARHGLMRWRRRARCLGRLLGGASDPDAEVALANFDLAETVLRKPLGQLRDQLCRRPLDLLERVLPVGHAPSSLLSASSPLGQISLQR